MAERTSFSNEEYADILFYYGAARGNAEQARREYGEIFPNRRLPDARVFSRTFRRMRERGTVVRYQGDAGRPRLEVGDDEEEILNHFQIDPTLSTRMIARRMGRSQWKVWYTLHENDLHPYHYTPVQAIEEGDPFRRMQFCRFLLNADVEDRNYLKRILWTDESKFDKDGITNYHNAHYWSVRVMGNPHLKRQKGSQRRFNLNVWMGIINNRLIGPHFLPQNLNGVEYESFLRNVFHELMEDMPLETRQNMIFMHDGCPAHFRLAVRSWLDQHFPDRWIGRGGPIPWPARSPDITPMDFFVWGRMKSLVYATDVPVPNIEDLRNRIINAAQEIQSELTDSRVVKTGVVRRARACIRNNGGHFENEL
ncbi:uncharacterized protein LOC121737150 [Aricia agestis]|uniref:uncharacterized protein LOC121737150 n=1 Tax=Aricia agestis TaxID=91739 RepID=UPI001C209D36|nr:uncharacterized protein LOC121737150 [Aricia agestis]